MSKGSKQRPKQITQEELDRRWKLAFGKELTTPAFRDEWEEEQKLAEPLIPSWKAEDEWSSKWKQ